MARSAQFGPERARIQPKLRMVANGDTVVNVLRSEHSGSLEARTDAVAKSAPVARPGSAPPLRAAKVPKKQKLKQFSDDIRASVFVTLKSDETKARIPGQTIREGNLVAARPSLAEIQGIAKMPGVLRVDLGDPLTMPRPVIGASTGAPSASERRVTKRASEHADGQGVLIGIIDVEGFDFAHADFLDAAGKTRFLRIWDQGGDARPGPGAPFNYGAEFTKAHLDAAIAAESSFHVPATELERQSQMAPGSHGTHVASIAAGNLGVCRKAPIAGVLISLPEEDLERRRSFYDSARVLHAVAYLMQVAKEEGLAAVSINISLGTNGHAHDGSSIPSRWIDSLLTVPGRCVSIAAGNAGQEDPTEPGDWGYVMGRIHSSGHIPQAGATDDLEWVVVGNGLEDLSENELEIWYSARDSFSVSVKPPGLPWTKKVAPGEFIENAPLADGTRLSIYNDRYHAANGENHIAVYLSPLLSASGVVGARPGMWLVRIEGKDVRNGAYHAWIERDDPRPLGPHGPKDLWLFPSFFSKWSNVDSHSVSSLACGQRVLSVANLMESPKQINPSSSEGPTRDGRPKPDVSAVGTDVVAANGFDPSADWISMTGTSMASPYVCGVAGLMLSINPELTAAQTMGIIRRTAKPLPGTDGSWNTEAGFGVIDADACVEEAAQVGISKDVTP